MPGQPVVPLERLKRGKTFGQGHLIIGSVDAVMAHPAHGDAPVQLLPAEVLLEADPAMELLRNEVMEGKMAHPATEGADAVFLTATCGER